MYHNDQYILISHVRILNVYHNNMINWLLIDPHLDLLIFNGDLKGIWKNKFYKRRAHILVDQSNNKKIKKKHISTTIIGLVWGNISREPRFLIFFNGKKHVKTCSFFPFFSLSNEYLSQSSAQGRSRDHFPFLRLYRTCRGGDDLFGKVWEKYTGNPSHDIGKNNT